MGLSRYQGEGHRVAEGSLMTLPLFLTAKNKLHMVVPFFVMGGGAYMLTNHFQFFTPQLLEMTWLDQMIPLLPASVWIYLSEYPFFLVVYANIKDYDNANKYLYSLLSLSFTSALIFAVWPTTYPRDLFPLPADGVDPLTRLAFTILREADQPTNCCPSLHVSSVYLSVFLFLDDQKKKLPFFFVWGTLIAISTMTTKQHYWVDVVSGFGLAVIFYLVFHRVVRYRRDRPVGAQAKR